MKQTIHKERLDAIRKSLLLEGADGFILPNSDEFFSEYMPEHEKRLEWLTGFTGSAATVIVLDHNQPERSAFFTDGRYTLQAQREVDSSLYEIHNISDVTPIEWLKKNAAGDTIGFDPWLISITEIKKWRKQARNIMWAALQQNPIDNLWVDRPTPTEAKAFDYPIEYSGESRSDKIKLITDKLKETSAEAVLLTQPESVNWLLNIRGNDIAHTPLLLSRAIVTVEGKVSLYAPTHKVPNNLLDGVKLYPENKLRKDCKRWNRNNILLQASSTPVKLWRSLKSSNTYIIQDTDPCTLPKSLKNETELQNIRKTHFTDGLALTKFLHWLSKEKTNPTELSASNRLLKFRKESKDFIEPSFPTISGFGANGAIIHYSVNEETNKQFANNNMYLVDSGGQYMGGTTDVTRTIAIGKPSEEMRSNYTRVLKGHIAISTSTFPKGTNGNQLDALARQPLWQAGLDYDHGTSHGVGCYMSVHEGPQSISKRSNGVALQQGMIISNEPGYYKNGEYGIRIENLVEIVPAAQEGFLTFKDLTCAPLDKNLVVESLLTDAEIAWWNSYHNWVWESLSSKLNDEEKTWLQEACQNI